MPHRPALPTLRRPVVALVAAATALVPVAGAIEPAQAATDATAVVISEVYGGGASQGASWQRDFVELHNPTDEAIDLSGTSVQYRSASGDKAPTGVTALSGSIPAHGYFLVAEGGGTASDDAQPLPPADVSGGIGLSATAGTVFLAARPDALPVPPTGSVPARPEVIDLVGYGTSNTFETAAAPAPSRSTSVGRDGTGEDSDDNSRDLTVAAATPGLAPEGSTDPTDPPTDPAPVVRSIAEIQGAGPASEYAGQSVTTRGVVTASYPTGGFNGFYLQTAGTGGTVDAGSHDRSDAVFVYGSSVARAVAPGDHVEVTGKVSEYQGTTEITPAAPDVKVLPEPASVQPTKVALPRTEEARESFEGMLIAPSGPFTVADNYALNQYAEIGLASGTTPLFTPTDVADPHDPAAIAAVKADNAARAITLDDGATTDFLRTGKDTALPYLSQQRQIRVGAPVSFTEPVVLEWRFDAWRLQPTGQLSAEGTPPASFAPTRSAAPRETGGNVRIASFNVLNYFPTTGEEVVAAGGSCSWYDDRTGDHVTVKTCTDADGGQGPRGAAEDEDLARQQAKIVSAVNALDADVVSLEELENSAHFGQERDAAISTLVDALNAAAGAGTWKFVPTPAAAGDQADEDVIRTGFIYRAAIVEPVGTSLIDDTEAFDNARDPLAQAFEPVGGGKYSRFIVVVNHFKSKSSGPEDPNGQGASNQARVAQAEELVRFAERTKGALGAEKVFLSGYFNAYTREDPMQVLSDAGFADIGSLKSPGEHTYLYDGTVGSLDHVLGNRPAVASVTGAHVWNISSVEPVALEYSRHNYNATDFYEPGPYRSSDHDPLVVGLDLPIGPVATSTSASVSPDPVEFKRDHPVVRVQVEAEEGVVDGGTVEVSEGKRLLGHATVRDGVATITLPTYNKKGRHVLQVDYAGSEDAAASRMTTSFTVVKTKG
jgi:predicted extracellular nuclease